MVIIGQARLTRIRVLHIILPLIVRMFIRLAITRIHLVLPCAVLITRSGAVYLENASLRGMGDSDFYWYDTAYFDRSIAYFIHFTNVNIFLSNYYTHWYGFNLRCFAI